MSEGTIKQGEPPPRQSDGRFATTTGAAKQRGQAPPDGYRVSRGRHVVNELDFPRQGRVGKTYGYNANTIARILGVSAIWVRRAARLGQFDIHDLESVISWDVKKKRPCAAGREGNFAVAPPLWPFYNNFSLIWKKPVKARGTNNIHLAVQMPLGELREDMTRLFWTHQHKLKGFRGNRRDLARRLYELDGIKREDQTQSMIVHGGITLGALTEIGVLVHDPQTREWSMAPFPKDFDGVADGLRRQGFTHVEIIHNHIAIGRDLFSLSDAVRLLAYMRTNKLEAEDCGRDKRLWIVTGMDRAMHGYRKRKIFRSGSGIPPKRVPSDAADRGVPA